MYILYFNPFSVNIHIHHCRSHLVYCGEVFFSMLVIWCAFTSVALSQHISCGWENGANGAESYTIESEANWNTKKGKRKNQANLEKTSSVKTRIRPISAHSKSVQAKLNTWTLPKLTRQTRFQFRFQSSENSKVDLSPPSTQSANLSPQKKTESKELSLSVAPFVKLHNFDIDSIVLAKQRYSIPWASVRIFFWW